MSEYMKRAIELAVRGAGNVSPNPMVGAVIVRNGEIIGEGWHEKYGQAHAEVNAIASVDDQNLLSEATMYVTLEPCSHWGKTPPCCELIIAKQIPRVVVGCIDPYHEVCGGGIERMRNAGIEVVVGDMERECVELNRRFFAVQTMGRPYIILKWAQTSDAKLDLKRPATVKPAWLTGGQGKQLVHLWRSQEDAIMVGRNTVFMDNPSLTVRAVQGRNPLRVITDRNLTLDTSYAVFNADAPTILITSIENRAAALRKFALRDNINVEVIDYTQPMLKQVLDVLTGRRVHSLFVEGGRELLQSFIDENLWDEARVFTSALHSDDLYRDITFSERECVDAPTIAQYQRSESANFDTSILLTYYK